MGPLHENFDLQRTAALNQHHCVRQLALIEFPDNRLEYLPLNHAALVQDILERRQQETCECSLLIEVYEVAARRLLEYSRDDARGYANARFLKLMVEDAEGKMRAVEDEAEAQVATSGSSRSSGGSDSCRGSN